MDQAIVEKTETSSVQKNETVYVTGSASTDDCGENVNVSKHPILMHKISVLRSSSTICATFRTVLKETTYQLGYEATMSLNTRPVQLTVPVGNDHISCTGKKLVERVALIPIMRSGLGMVDAMLELVPDSGVHHIGMYKQKSVPVQYYNRLPKKCESDVAYILDAVLASAQTVLCVVSILKKWGVKKIHVICVIASKEGLKTLSTSHPDIYITVGQVDSDVDERGNILPGLGDSGDRLYSTPVDNDEEDLMHTSKRKFSF